MILRPRVFSSLHSKICDHLGQLPEVVPYIGLTAPTQLDPTA